MSNKKLFIDLTKSISPSNNKFQVQLTNPNIITSTNTVTTNSTSLNGTNFPNNVLNNGSISNYLLNNINYTNSAFGFCEVDHNIQDSKSSPVNNNSNPKRVPSSPRSCCSTSSVFSTSSNFCTTTNCSSNLSSKTNQITSSSSSISSKCLTTSSSSSSTISFQCESSNCSSHSNTSNTRLSTPDYSSTSSTTSLDEEMSKNQVSSSLNSSENSINTNSTSIAKITRSTVRKTSNKNTENYEKEEINEQRNEMNETSNGLKCLWYRCGFISQTSDAEDSHSLVEHIKSKHIFSQKNQRKFRCLWKGCTVYKNPSCSFNWLERHVIDHIETKPFVCIFTGCKRKFRTEAARERHVQSHINTSSHNSTQPSQTQSSPSPIKTRNRLLLKSAKIALIQNIKNKSKINCIKALQKQTQEENNTEKIENFQTGKSTNDPKADSENCSEVKLPNYAQLFKALTKRKRPQQDASIKKFKKVQYKDYLDDFSLKVIENKLKSLNYNSGTITFQAKIIAHHYNSSTNNDHYLVEWSPKNIIENEWIEKSKLIEKKQVSISELFKNKEAIFNNPFFNRHRFRSNRRK